MTIGAGDTGIAVNGIGKIVLPITMAGSTQRFIGQPKFLGMRHVAADTLHAGLRMPAVLPLGKGAGMAIFTYRRVDPQ